VAIFCPLFVLKATYIRTTFSNRSPLWSDDARLDAYKASVNLVPTPDGIGMDILYGLYNSRYTEFKAEIVNNIQKGILIQ
jgi:hypothetical protein